MSTQKKTNTDNVVKFSAKALDGLNALNLSESVKSASGKRSIFKSDYNDKRLRTKYRNKLISTKKVETETGVLEVQNGLIPIFLLQIKKGNFAEAKKTFSEISEICKKVYVAENKFQSADDYFSGNRSEQTQNILKAFIAVANEM